MPTVSVNTFSGLDLRDDPQELTGAIDLLNVDFDQPGRVRTRDGYTQLTAGSGDSIIALALQGAVGNFITLGSNQIARARSNTGAILASSAALASTPQNLTKLGTPANAYIYAGTGDALGRTLRWDGSAWAYPATGYSAFIVATTPWDNRLVLANENSPTTNGSKVRFSDPGAPDTFGANNYVDLTPGDDEAIIAMCVWGAKLFVFKRTKFFVFYATNTDSTGNPVFNYRTVDVGLGTGVLLAGSRSGDCVAMDDGVYFHNAQGLFVTTGGPPTKVSAPVDPLYSIGSAPYFLGTYGFGVDITLTRFRKKVIISQTSRSLQLIYDTEQRTWTFWTLSGTCFLEYASVAGAAPIPMFATIAGGIGKMSSASTTDNGSAIASRYRTGFMDLGAPEQEKWLRSMMLSGTGTVNVKTAVNDAAALSSAVSVAMGASPAVGTGRWGAGTRGRNISVEVSAASGAWSLSHLSLDIAATRAPGVRAA